MAIGTPTLVILNCALAAGVRLLRASGEWLSDGDEWVGTGHHRGSRSRLAFYLLVAIAAVTLTTSPVASAQPGYSILPAERFSQLTVRGTQGFRITIRRIAGHVELTAARRTVTASYLVRRERGSADGIKATFPGLGRVSMRFRPSGRLQRGPAFCEGRRPITQHGEFSGVIRFRGERDFTRVSLQNARGFVYRSFKETCKGGGGRSGDFSFYALAESGRSQGRTTSFTALKLIDNSEILGSALYSASQLERRHGMTSLRFAAVSAGWNTFAIGPTLGPQVAATVAPPPPFSGTASFQASPGERASWEGTLAVDLPGVETVDLTGPQFRPVLCRNRRCLGRPHGGENPSVVVTQPLSLLLSER